MGESNGTGVTVTDDQQQELALVARKVEKRIDGILQAMRTQWVELAGCFYFFTKEKMWESLGYDSLAEWLASPDRGLPAVSDRGAAYSESYIYKLGRTYRKLVVERHVPIAELRGIDLDKVQTVLPAIEDGSKNWKDALDDTRVYPRHDLRVHYQEGGDAPIDPGREVAKVQCDHCGSWVAKSKLEAA